MNIVFSLWKEMCIALCCLYNYVVVIHVYQKLTPFKKTMLFLFNAQTKDKIRKRKTQKDRTAWDQTQQDTRQDKQKKRTG